MATRGNRPKPPHLKLVEGNRGRRPINLPARRESRKGPLRPPKRLTKAQQKVWKRFINPAHWITDFDAHKAYVWTCLQAQFESDPAAAKPAMIGQLRLIGSELGLDPSARARLGITTEKNDDPNDAYFD